MPLCNLVRALRHETRHEACGVGSGEGGQSIISMRSAASRLHYLSLKSNTDAAENLVYP